MTDYLRNDTIQAALLAYMQSKTDITSELGSSSDIKETQWQGRDFDYPAVRIRIISNTPVENSGCRHDVNIGIQVFSEQASSLEASQIAGIIGNTLHRKQFSSDSLNFALWVTDTPGAVRSDIQTWRSEVLLRGIVSG